jgi:hypothetical protein
LEVLRHHSCTRLLNYNRPVLDPWDHSTDWIAAGLTHFAHVVSPESFAALSAEMMLEKICRSFRMRTFENVEDTIAWLATA